MILTDRPSPLSHLFTIATSSIGQTDRGGVIRHDIHSDVLVDRTRVMPIESSIAPAKDHPIIAAR